MEGGERTGWIRKEGSVNSDRLDTGRGALEQARVAERLGRREKALHWYGFVA
jgi:hypothetical protein